jgi:hypothetical protein
VKRRPLTLFAAISLLLFVAMVALTVWSYDMSAMMAIDIETRSFWFEVNRGTVAGGWDTYAKEAQGSKTFQTSPAVVRDWGLETGGPSFLAFGAHRVTAAYPAIFMIWFPMWFVVLLTAALPFVGFGAVAAHPAAASRSKRMHPTRARWKREAMGVQHLLCACWGWRLGSNWRTDGLPQGLWENTLVRCHCGR